MEIYAAACGCVSVIPKSETSHLLIVQAISQLRATSAALAELKKEMLHLAELLPEYPVVQKMYGVGPILGPQLMAEIGDVRRFYSKKALVAFAGMDAPPNDSGQISGSHKPVSKICLYISKNPLSASRYISSWTESELRESPTGST